MFEGLVAGIVGVAIGLVLTSIGKLFNLGTTWTIIMIVLFISLTFWKYEKEE